MSKYAFSQPLPYKDVQGVAGSGQYPLLFNECKQAYANIRFDIDTSLRS